MNTNQLTILGIWLGPSISLININNSCYKKRSRLALLISALSLLEK